MKKAEQYAALHIGAVVDKVAAERLQKFVIAVLNSSAGDAVKIAALQTSQTAFGITNTNVSNCNFQNSRD